MADLIDLESHRARRMAEGEARLRADEEAAGAQLVAMWASYLSRHQDPTAAALLWLADALDELLEADDLESMKVAALQLANGARLAAVMRARKARMP